MQSEVRSVIALLAGATAKEVGASWLIGFLELCVLEMNDE
jgi:hypothetical protein